MSLVLEVFGLSVSLCSCSKRSTLPAAHVFSGQSMFGGFLSKV